MKFEPISGFIKFPKVPIALGKGIEHMAGWPHRVNPPEQGMLETWQKGGRGYESKEEDSYC